MTVSIKSPTSTTGSIQLNGSDVLTIDSSGNLTASNKLVVTDAPAFRAYLSANQNVTTTTYTKVACDTIVFDTANDYDTTNYRFTPSVAGYYQVNYALRFDAASDPAVSVGTLYKNGVRESVGFVDRTGQRNSIITSTQLII